MTYNFIVKQEFAPILLRKGYIINGKYIKVEAIFGLRNSSLQGGEQEPCIVCFDNNKDTIIEPCNHLCLCEACAKELKKASSLCPMCRQEFTEFTKLKLNDDKKWFHN